jgi:CMP-2-keto-3-deoxyoctulosonic acid synthetase
MGGVWAMAELEELVDAADSAAAVVVVAVLPVDAVFTPEAEASGLARTAEVAATAVTRAR